MANSNDNSAGFVTKPMKSLSYRPIPINTSENNNNNTSSDSYLSLFNMHPNKSFSSSCLSPLPPKSKLSKDPKDSPQVQSISSLSAFAQKTKNNNFKQIRELLYPQLKSFTRLQPFADHEFWFCKEGFRSTNEYLSSCSFEEQQSYSALPIISIACAAKAIQFVEFQNKKNVLSVHLTNKLSAVLNTSSPIITSSSVCEELFQEKGQEELYGAFNELSRELSLLQEIPSKLPFSREYMQKEIHKTVGKQTKACICLAYTRNDKGFFELSGIHMNEKFLIYTKWESEIFMINTLETAVPELFTEKNYQIMQSKAMSAITSALTGESSIFEFNGELLTSDGTIREANMSVQGTFQENSLLLVNFMVEKVIREKKIFTSKKDDKSLRITSKSIESNATQKRKASSSCNSEDNNYHEEETLTQQEKVFLQRFYSL